MRWDITGFVGVTKPAMPIRWVVQGPHALSPEQRAQLQSRVQGFLTQCRLSHAPTQWANGALTDGSRYRLYAYNGAVEVLVEPRSDANKITNFVAWPVIYEPGYVSPLYEREYIDDEPVPLGYVLERETYQPFFSGSVNLGFFLNTRVVEIHIRGMSFIQTSSFTPTKWDDGAYGVYSYAGVLPGVSKNIGASFGFQNDQSYDRYHRIDSIDVNESRIAIATSMRTEGGSWIHGIFSLSIPRAPDSIGHFEVGTGTEHWRGLCSGTVTTDYSQSHAAISVDATATVALCEAIIEELRTKPHPLIPPKRIDGRTHIAASVLAWCKRGLGDDPHRNARILQFPYLTPYKPKASNWQDSLKQGSLSALSVQAVGANRLVKQVSTQSILDAAHKKAAVPWNGQERGEDLTPLMGFRSAVVNATLSKLVVTTPDYHGVEPAQCKVNAFASTISEWMVHAQKQGLEKAPKGEQGAPIVFDEQIPPGVQLVLLHLEYEVFDPYTGQWIWSAVPKMVQCDAVWVPPLTNYRYVFPDGEASIRSVRAVGATKHVRTKTGWGQGVDVSFGAWSARYVSKDLAAPSAIAIAINLPTEAYPATATSEGVLWKWGADDASALRKVPLTGVSHICAHALKIAGVDKRS